MKLTPVAKSILNTLGGEEFVGEIGAAPVIATKDSLVLRFTQSPTDPEPYLVRIVVEQPGSYAVGLYHGARSDDDDITTQVAAHSNVKPEGLQELLRTIRHRAD